MWKVAARCGEMFWIWRWKEHLWNLDTRCGPISRQWGIFVSKAGSSKSPYSFQTFKRYLPLTDLVLPVRKKSFCASSWRWRGKRRPMGCERYTIVQNGCDIRQRKTRICVSVAYRVETSIYNVEETLVCAQSETRHCRKHKKYISKSR